VHVDGRYNSDEEPEEQVVHITRGYSRDHRPDLNQVMLELIVEHQADIPILMKPLSGNSSDAQHFGEAVRTHVHQLQTTYGMTYLVADSALYSEANLQQLAQTRMKWITRVPATVNAAQTVLAQADPPALASLKAGYRYHELTSTYGRLSNVGSSSTLSPAERRRTAPSTSSGAARMTKKSKPSRNYVALPSRAKPMRVRRFRPSSRTCTPRFWAPARCTLSPAMVNGVDPHKKLDPTRWSTRSTGPWPPRSLLGKPSSTSTVVHPGHQ
jgi:hypothetical protein